MPGSVDHVQGVGFAVDDPRQADRLGFDRDPPLALDVHAVEVLVPHGALVDDPRQLEHPVRQRRLSVVDVGDDAEIADARRRRRSGGDLAGKGCGHSSPLSNSLHQCSARRPWPGLAAWGRCVNFAEARGLPGEFTRDADVRRRRRGNGRPPREFVPAQNRRPVHRRFQSNGPTMVSCSSLPVR